MNYKENIYAFIKAHPGCRSYEIWTYLDELAEAEFANKSAFIKWLDTIPIINIFTMPIASLGRIYTNLETLEDEGMIRSVKESGKYRYYPTGAQPPTKSPY